jgi:hypothetical protein
MKLDFDFRYTTKSFDLSERDTAHYSEHNRFRMHEWSGPLSMNALNGVNWDKVLSNFPYYSLKCRTCDYVGDDYDKYGQPRPSLVTSKVEPQS